MKEKLFIKNFDSINDFWKSITTSKKWYSEYSPNQIEDIDEYIEDIAPLILKKTNQLRFSMDFTVDEYEKIIGWDNLIFKNENIRKIYEPNFKQYCSNCRKEINLLRRYPKRICEKCKNEIRSKDGRKVEYFNSNLMGTGCQGYYSDTQQSELYNSNECYIEKKTFIAKEGRFGGIIIELK